MNEEEWPKNPGPFHDGDPDYGPEEVAEGWIHKPSTSTDAYKQFTEGMNINWDIVDEEFGKVSRNFKVVMSIIGLQVIFDLLIFIAVIK